MPSLLILILDGYKEFEKLVKLIPSQVHIPFDLIIGSCVQENVHRLKWCMLYHCGWKRIVSLKGGELDKLTHVFGVWAEQEMLDMTLLVVQISLC